MTTQVKNLLGVELMNSILSSYIIDSAHLIESWTGADTETKKLVSTIGTLGKEPTFYTQTLPKIGKLLDKKLAGSETWSRAQRFLDVNEVVGYPSFMDWHFRIIFNNGVQDPRAWAVVGVVRQICYLFYKLRGGEPMDSHKEALDEFVHRDQSLGQHWRDLDESPRNRTMAVIGIARTICHLILGGVDLRNITPRHGPGAVSTGEKPWDKMNFKRFICRLDEEYSYSEYFFLNTTHLCEHLQDFLKLEEVEPKAKIVLVPKDSRGPRIISCEPLELQWIQQGIMRVLVEVLEKHPISSGHVWFSNQTCNQEEARRGSINNDLATLDFKDASDRVSTKLVQRLFPKHIYRKVCACRSLSTILPDGREVEFNKFAPMGSALCFPVMSLIIFSLIVATRLSKNVTSDRISARNIRSACKDIYVFGDDLICPKSLFSDFQRVIESVGLKLNADKCCLGPYFRESCGTDWFDGRNVTPIRIKTLYPMDRAPESLLSTIAYAIAFAKVGMYRTAHLLGNLCEKHANLPRTSNLDGSVDFDFNRSEADGRPLTLPCADPRKAYKFNSKHFKRRFNTDLQRVEFLVPVVATTKKVVASGWSEYFRWHVQHGSEFRAHRYTVPHRIKIKMRWSPL